MQVNTFDSADTLADAAADLITDRLSTATGDRVNLALAGGSTPEPTYRRLARRPIDWARTDVWLSDERWVPHDSDESNGLMAQRTLLDHVAGAAFHRPRHTENLEPAEAAAYYEATLRSIIPGGRADVVLLGMGTDGHTASLFPGTKALTQPTTRWFVENHVPALDTWRLTVTPRFLEQVATIVVIVAGPEKADVLAEVVEHPVGRYPIEILHDCAGEVVFMADAAAASGLD